MGRLQGAMGGAKRERGLIQGSQQHVGGKGASARLHRR